MADVTTVLPGAFEDHLGRRVHPATYAKLVAMQDGKSVEEKVADLLGMFAGYLPKSGGGSILYARDHVDFTYAISANASSGPVTAKFTINGLTVEGVPV